MEGKGSRGGLEEEDDEEMNKMRRKGSGNDKLLVRKDRDGENRSGGGRLIGKLRGGEG